VRASSRESVRTGSRPRPSPGAPVARSPSRDVFKLAQEGAVKELGLVVKADVAGSLEALEDEIAKLPQQEVAVNIIHRGVGGINESDVMLAAAPTACILAFNVRPVGDARQVAEREGVEIRSYSVIYRAIDELRAAMQACSSRPRSKRGSDRRRCDSSSGPRGSARSQAPTSRRGGSRAVPGCASCATARSSTTRRSRACAVSTTTCGEVTSGFECGIVLSNFQDLHEGDVLETYETRKVERELSS